MTVNRTPHAPALRQRKNGSRRHEQYLVLRCPFCGRRRAHRHSTLGNTMKRVAGCNGGYYILHPINEGMHRQWPPE